MTISQMENLSLFLMVLAIVFGIISIILFWVFDIRRICKITNKYYIKGTIKMSKNIVKNYESTVSESKSNASGCESTILMQENHASGCESTVLMHENYASGCEPTVLMSENHAEGCNHTERLNNSGVNLLQDITYINEING